MILALALTDRFGRTVPVELAVRRDTIEIRCRERLVGVCRRDILRAWMDAPSGQLDFDETSLLPVPNGFALAIEPTVPCWPLSDDEVHYLRMHV